jgi:hypothetical protein
VVIMSHRGPDPVRCGWGRLSLVQAQRKALGWVAANIPGFSWFLLISGQDYPVRPMKLIEAELAASRRDGYVRHFLIADDVGFLCGLDVVGRLDLAPVALVARLQVAEDLPYLLFGLGRDGCAVAFGRSTSARASTSPAACSSGAGSPVTHCAVTRGTKVLERSPGSGVGSGLSCS